MAVIEDGANSGRKLTVNTENAIPVSLTQTLANAGYVKLLDSNGDEILTTETGALNTSSDSMLFFEQVDGVAVNTNVWNQSTSGMSIAQAGGFITLNSASALTAGAYAILSSIKNLALYGHLPLRMSFNAKVPITPQSNCTMELGIGSVSTNASPTDGAFFRLNSVGEVRCVINYNGTETSSAAIAAPVVDNTTLFDIVVVEDLVQFLVDDELVASVSVPPGQAYPTSSGRLPIFARVYNGGSSPAEAPQISIGQVIAVQEALNQNRIWRESLAVLGRGLYQSPVTAFAQTANHVNSVAPATGTPTNTTAGYTTLGGRWQIAAPAGAATDLALFGYQVPVGYQLFITGIAIAAANMGAVVATIATLLDWALGVNASAVSLATADGAGTWAPRRIPLGLQSFALAAAIGTTAPDIVRTFDPPLVVDGGRFLHAILRVPSGAATASQLLYGNVTFSGYFE